MRFPAEPLRRALLSSLPAQTSQFGDRLPDPRFLYVPRAHARALSFDTMLVRGIRGSGKSLWWSALQEREHRKIIARGLGPDAVDVEANVSKGFGGQPAPEAYPGPDTLKQLLTSHDARDIWWTVVLSHLLDESTRGQAGPFGDHSTTWGERVAWLIDNPERRERIVHERDQEFARSGRRQLILFDALDRASNDWRSRIVLLRGLLRVLLDLRSYKAIRAKAFVRPDMLDSAEVTNFPDASKVVTNDVRLSWPRIELYGLLWQHLANAPDGGDVFRSACAEHIGGTFLASADDKSWRVNQLLLQDEGIQRDVFHAIAGPYMGSDRRRGLPYTWLPGHLADAQEQVSPRSFLAALRKAAERESGHDGHALSYRSIQDGVQEASAVRVTEVVEDFPWIKPTLDSLHGLVLPCSFEQIEGRWRGANLTAKLEQMERRPQHLNEGFAGIRGELEELGIFERMYDGRVNMPDVYRVGSGLKRKGGVKPVR